MYFPSNVSMTVSAQQTFAASSVKVSGNTIAFFPQPRPPSIHSFNCSRASAPPAAVFLRFYPRSLFSAAHVRSHLHRPSAVRFRGACCVVTFASGVSKYTPKKRSSLQKLIRTGINKCLTNMYNQKKILFLFITYGKCLIFCVCTSDHCCERAKLTVYVGF